MNNGGALGVWLFLTVVSSTAIAAVFWSVRSREKMRHEIVLKLIESGRPFDSAALDKLLARPSAPASRPPDPRDGYRYGGFIYFLLGFFTIVFGVARSAGVSFPLIGLGLISLVLAVRIWWLGDRDFRDGSLPTLKYQRDPREAHQSGGGVFFLIGYGTAFAGIVRGAGLSYSLIGLGLLVIVMACLVWSVGDKEYREGRLTGGVLRAPDRE